MYIYIYYSPQKNHIFAWTSYSPVPRLTRRCGNIATHAFYVAHHLKLTNELCFTLVVLYLIRNTSRDRKMNSSIRKTCVPRNIIHYLL